jgi:hypothetical protein
VSALAALTVSAAGCGSSASHGSDPSSVVKSFFAAAGAGDGKRACALLTAEEQSKVVTGGTCVQEMSRFGAALAQQLRGLRLGSASVHGQTATVRVTTPSKSTTVTLHRRGGGWVISSLGSG